MINWLYENTFYDDLNQQWSLINANCQRASWIELNTYEGEHFMWSTTIVHTLQEIAYGFTTTWEHPQAAYMTTKIV